MLARSKLKSIGVLICRALTDLEIINGEYKSVINKEENYNKLKKILELR